MCRISVTDNTSKINRVLEKLCDNFSSIVRSEKVNRAYELENFFSNIKINEEELLDLKSTILAYYYDLENRSHSNPFEIVSKVENINFELKDFFDKIKVNSDLFELINFMSKRYKDVFDFILFARYISEDNYDKFVFFVLLSVFKNKTTEVLSLVHSLYNEEIGLNGKMTFSEIKVQEINQMLEDKFIKLEINKLRLLLGLN